MHKGVNSSVVKLDGGRQYSVVFQADVKDWAELIPGYMHIRIQSDMLISRSSEPKDDIVERNNRFYVYLKPQGSRRRRKIKRRFQLSPASRRSSLQMPPLNGRLDLAKFWPFSR